ncbi:family 20 glycosylhydrolase [Streptomyces tanashiensis]
MRYSIRGPRRGPALLATAVALATVAACSNGSPSGPSGPSSTGATASAAPTSAPPPSPTPKPTPTPTKNYPLSTAPRTVPSVRAHEAARGPGWKPAPTGGVVLGANSEALADEGRLLAGELGIPYRGAAAAGAGDVELAVGGTGAPESYTLTVRDGRVRIAGPDEAGVFYGTRTLKQSVKATGRTPGSGPRSTRPSPRSPAPPWPCPGRAR